MTKQIFKALTKQINYQNIVLVPFDTIPFHVWKPSSTLENPIYLRLIRQLRIRSLRIFELYSDLFVSLNISSKVNLSERAATDFPAEPKLTPNTKFHRQSTPPIVKTLTILLYQRFFCFYIIFGIDPSNLLLLAIRISTTINKKEKKIY